MNVSERWNPYNKPSGIAPSRVDELSDPGNWTEFVPCPAVLWVGACFNTVPVSGRVIVWANRRVMVMIHQGMPDWGSIIDFDANWPMTFTLTAEQAWKAAQVHATAYEADLRAYDAEALTSYLSEADVLGGGRGCVSESPRPAG